MAADGNREGDVITRPATYRPTVLATAVRGRLFVDPDPGVLSAVGFTVSAVTDRSMGVGAAFTVRDCERAVTLSFDAALTRAGEVSWGTLAAAREKMDNFERAWRQFRTAFEVAAAARTRPVPDRAPVQVETARAMQDVVECMNCGFFGTVPTGQDDCPKCEHTTLADPLKGDPRLRDVE